ncbi:MAG: hypothetical protein LBH16_04045 [Treponema sp.]|jgi:hypothetical protein|nr:hypothetical protein [Treponema sp.]
MKKLAFIITILAIFALAGCTSSGGGNTTAAPRQAAQPELPPPPAGTERLTLGNAGLAIYRFDLPDGQTWSNYNKLTAEYLVDEENITKSLRSGAVRLYGNYKDSHFSEDGKAMTVSLSDNNMFARMIIDHKDTTWAAMGAVADEWFTYEYVIDGSRAHGQYNKDNIPAGDAKGPFYFALGLTSQDEGRRYSITQLVRNITLHHADNPDLNVVSTGSGFELPASAAYFPTEVKRQMGQ